MKLNLYGVIALGLLVTGSVVSAVFGQSELGLVLAGIAGGSLVPQLGRSEK